MRTARELNASAKRKKQGGGGAASEKNVEKSRGCVQSIFRAKHVCVKVIFFSFFRFALAFSSLAVLTARSSIEKHEKIEGCGQSKLSYADKLFKGGIITTKYHRRPAFIIRVAILLTV